MASLKEFLKEKNYKVFDLQQIHTNHFKIKMKLNGVVGDFIVDTGASNTCIGFEGIEKFFLKTEVSDVKAAGAGATEMETHKAAAVPIKIGWWKTKIDVVILDLSHVNIALKNHLAEEIDGILGADLLQKGDAVIDYAKSRLYLKKL
ncbi:MAG: retropepsin-like aspartic protease [Flavobacteriaceae bacterium]|nr:retropepsin-like aspartic protease [Flavobacteriaceae bacterium]